LNTIAEKYHKAVQKVSLKNHKINHNPHEFFHKQIGKEAITDQQVESMIKPLKLYEQSYHNQQLKNLQKSINPIESTKPKINCNWNDKKSLNSNAIDISDKDQENFNKRVMLTDQNESKRLKLMPSLGTENKNVSEQHPKRINYNFLTRNSNATSNAQKYMDPKLKEEINCSLNKYSHAKKIVNEKPIEEIKEKEYNRNINSCNEQRKDPFSHFKTAGQELQAQNLLSSKPMVSGLSKKNINKQATSTYRPIESFLQNQINHNDEKSNYNDNPVRNKFINPVQQQPLQNVAETYQSKPENVNDDPIFEHPLLSGFERAIIERVKREVVVDAKNVGWDDVAGLNNAKQLIKESVIFPILRPDLFVGLRAGSKAILLFGL
jgi:SpoVK/Ycf46/Vps4 family AAA+-type ATPase